MQLSLILWTEVPVAFYLFNISFPNQDPLESTAAGVYPCLSVSVAWSECYYCNSNWKRGKLVPTPLQFSGTHLYPKEISTVRTVSFPTAHPELGANQDLLISSTIGRQPYLVHVQSKTFCEVSSTLALLSVLPHYQNILSQNLHWTSLMHCDSLMILHLIYQECSYSQRHCLSFE